MTPTTGSTCMDRRSSDRDDLDDVLDYLDRNDPEWRP
jgi:hypothetical protein